MTVDTQITPPSLGAFLERWWGRDESAATTIALPLPSAAAVLEQLECGLLATPYLEVHTDGRREPDARVFTTRMVQTHRLPGFADRDFALDRLRAGSTLRFPGVDHWCAAARPVLEAARAASGQPLQATAVLAPEGAELALPTRAFAPALAVQCSGTASWQLAGDAEPVTAAPGAAFGLPRGADARASVQPGGGGGLVLVLEGVPVTARALVAAVGELTAQRVERGEPIVHHYLLDAGTKADRVGDTIRAFCAGLTPEDLLRRLLDAQR